MKRLDVLTVSLLLQGLLLAADKRVEMPFQLQRGYIVLAPGAIGEARGLEFLVDTGAVPSVVDRRIAERLRLTGSADRLSVFQENVEAQRVVLPVLQFGPIRAESVPVLVRDLSFIEHDFGIRVDAMIGLDVLSRSSFIIDYRSKKIYFGPEEAAETDIPFRPGRPYIVVEMQILTRSVRLLLDTGAKDLVLFESRVRDCLAGMRILGKKASSNLSGEVVLKRVQLSATRLGLTELSNQEAFLLDTALDTLPDFDGLLGVTALGFRRIEFNFERNTVNWKK